MAATPPPPPPPAETVRRCPGGAASPCELLPVPFPRESGGDGLALPGMDRAGTGVRAPLPNLLLDDSAGDAGAVPGRGVDAPLAGTDAASAGVCTGVRWRFGGVGAALRGIERDSIGVRAPDRGAGGSRGGWRVPPAMPLMEGCPLPLDGELVSTLGDREWEALANPRTKVSTVVTFSPVAVTVDAIVETSRPSGVMAFVTIS
mmetsp:Transcript_24700/g.72638  ORF Transcript_24700/g.72638 Transcript_24700/m.72638 type:complete len:203 (-) Transcript_24700:520-1128(-)